MARVDVYDWDGYVNEVTLGCPVVIGSTLAQFSQLTTETWEAELINNTGAPVGEYGGLIKASSTNSGGLALYDKVSIVVSHEKDGWAKTWGGTEFDYGWQVETDSMGNIYVLGWFGGTVDFNPGPPEDLHTAQGFHDTFLSKFDPDGNFLWARTWGHSFSSDFTIDGDDNINIVGLFWGEVDFDPGDGENIQTAIGTEDFFMSRFDPDGNHIWVKTWGGLNLQGEFDTSGGIVIGDSGAIYVTGTFCGYVDFDPEVGEHWVEANGFNDMFLSKFDSNGVFIWVETWGKSDDETQGETSRDIEYDGWGNVFCVGYFSGDVDFDPGPLEEWHFSNGGNDVFMSKFDSAGNLDWTLSWGGNSSDRAFSITGDDNDFFYIIGYFSDVIDIDPGPIVDLRTSYGQDDIFLSKIDTNGDLMWANTWGGEQNDNGFSVATFGNEFVYVTGYFTGDVDFDPGPSFKEYSSIEFSDIFVSKFETTIGGFKWARPFGGIGQDWNDESGHGITTDNTGNIFVTGYYQGTIDFDPSTDEDWHNSNSGGGYPDAFLMKLLPNGYWE